MKNGGIAMTYVKKVGSHFPLLAITSLLRAFWLTSFDPQNKSFAIRSNMNFKCNFRQENEIFRRAVDIDGFHENYCGGEKSTLWGQDFRFSP